MKKIMIIVFVLTTIFLVGCSNTEKIEMKQDFTVVSTQSISISELEQMIQNEESFILYISSETCSSCSDFKPYIIEYIENNHVLIYQIEADDEYPTDNQILSYEFTPTLCFVLNGKTIEKSNPISNESAYASTDGLTKYMKQYINITK